MKTLATLLALSLAISFGPRDAKAATPILDGNSLYRWCTSDGATALACHAYIRSIYERFVLDATIRSGDPSFFCVSSTVDYEQVKDIVVVYLREHPAQRDGFAITLVDRALAQAFPDCAR